MWSYLCGRVAQRNIDVLSAEKKVDRRLDDLQTNRLDVITSCVGRITHTWGEERNDALVNTSTLAWTYTRTVRKGEDTQDITKCSIANLKNEQKTINNENANMKRIKHKKEKLIVGRSAIKCRWRRCYEAEKREQQDGFYFLLFEINFRLSRSSQNQKSLDEIYEFYSKCQHVNAHHGVGAAAETIFSTLWKRQENKWYFNN